ncbi:MAG: hypothetical protein WC570_01215 [Patescibacteria group bacterium]
MLKINKHILLISSWGPPMIGGPQNLYNLFSLFNKDEYSFLTSYNQTFSLINDKNKGNVLPCKYYFIDFDNVLFKSKRQNNYISKRNTFKESFINLTKTFPFLYKFIISYFIPVVTIVKFIKNAVKIQKETNSKLLIGISDSGSALISTLITHWITKQPYVIYFFDIYKENYLTGINKYLAKILESTLVKNAKYILVTNERTEEFFKNKYGNYIKTAVIYNSTFLDQYIVKSNRYNPQQPYKTIYTGNVSWPQEQSLLNLINAIEYLNELQIELHLYIPNIAEHLKNIFNTKQFIKLNSAQPLEIPNILNGADLLFLPLSWNTKNPDIIATATPGKFTDYLGAGKPMLIHAPEYAYISEYAKKYNLGIVVDKNDPKILADSIQKFFSNPSVGEIFIKNSLSVFHANHDAQKNAERLKNIINSI